MYVPPPGKGGYKEILKARVNRSLDEGLWLSLNGYSMFRIPRDKDRSTEGVKDGSGCISLLETT